MLIPHPQGCSGHWGLNRATSSSPTICRQENNSRLCSHGCGIILEGLWADLCAHTALPCHSPSSSSSSSTSANPHPNWNVQCQDKEAQRDGVSPGPPKSSGGSREPAAQGGQGGALSVPRWSQLTSLFWIPERAAMGGNCQRDKPLNSESRFWRGASEETLSRKTWRAHYGDNEGPG